MPIVGKVEENTKGMFEDMVDFLASDVLKMNVKYFSSGNGDIDCSMLVYIPNVLYHTISCNYLRMRSWTPYCSDIVSYDKYYFLIKTPSKLSNYKVLSVLFPHQLWTCILLCFIGISTVWYLFSKCCKQQDAFIKTLLNFYSLSLGICINVRTNRIYLRITLIVYGLYALTMYSMFQGRLISVIYSPGFEKSLDTVEELAHSDLKIEMLEVLVKSFNDFNDSLAIELRKKFVIKKMKPGYESAFAADATYGSGLIFEFNMDRGHFKKIPYDYLSKFEQTLPFRPGSPYVSAFNELAIPKLHENGFLIKIKRDIGNKYMCKNCTNEDSQIVLTLSHLSVAFVILFGGLLLATLVFTVEFIVLKLAK